MARGTFVGMIWGALVSVVAAGALSLAVDGAGPRKAAAPEAVVEPVREAAPVVVEPEAVEPEAVEPEVVETDVVEPDVVETEVVDTEVVETEVVVTETVPDGVAETAKPEAAQPQEEVAAAVDRQTSGRRPPPETAVERVAPPSVSLTAPERTGQPGADTAPPSAPEVGEADALPEAVAADGTAAAIAVVPDAPASPAAQPAVPDRPARDAAPDPSVAPDQPPPPPVPTIETALVPDPEEAPGQDASAEDVVREEPDAGIAIGEPAAVLTDRGGAVSSRLPRIGAAEPEPEPAPALAEDSPLLRYAAGGATATENDLPRLAVILIDDGSGPLGPEALRAFPFPVTFAIDPAHPDAAETARAYRALGFEVMAMADLPEGAAATDVEVTLASVLDSVPEAVAVLESPVAGLQGNRDVSMQAAAYLAASGHGLVMQPRGLNTAQALVAREGVPSATLFRDFDGEGQDATAIRRVLDTAAFRARQDGSVVMLGRLRADTVSALVLWGLQDRASELALVPVSTVLREAAATE